MMCLEHLQFTIVHEYNAAEQKTRSSNTEDEHLSIPAVHLVQVVHRVLGFHDFLSDLVLPKSENVIIII